MVANLSITKGKVITSGVAGILGALVFLTAIHIAAKIFVIAFAAIATYLAFSVIQKILAKKNDVSTKTEEQSDVSGDEGYDSADEEKDTVISAEEKIIEVEAIKERTVKEMKKGLPEYMDINGNALPDNIKTNTENHVSVKEGMVVPDRIVLSVQADSKQNTSQNDESQTQYKSDYMSLMKESPPLHMDGYYNPISRPSTLLSAEELLLQWQKDDKKAFTEQYRNHIGKAPSKQGNF